jgi:replicative DNA helicase
MPTYWPALELSNQFVKEQKDRHANPDAYRGYRFPMEWWMKRTGGWQKGSINYIYAKAGVGKTSFLSTACVQNGIDDVPYVYFALEESVFTTAERIFANLGDINRTKFRDIQLDHSDFMNLYQAAGEFSNFDAYFCDEAWSDTEILSVLTAIDQERIANNQPPVEVIYLDYLQLMTMDASNGMADNVAKASKFLTRLAKGKVVTGKKCVIASVQLNDDGEPLWSRDPSRDGDLIGEMENIDDGFGEPQPDKRKLRIRKNRNGGPDACTMAFIGGRSLVGQLLGPVAAGKMKPPKP